VTATGEVVAQAPSRAAALTAIASLMFTCFSPG
jgi:hypothetical protein